MNHSVESAWRLKCCEKLTFSKSNIKIFGIVLYEFKKDFT